MVSDYKKPLNIGSDEMVSMNQMAELVMKIGSKPLPIKCAAIPKPPPPPSNPTARMPPPPPPRPSADGAWCAARRHIPGPEGVRGRNSDNTLIKEVLGWAPATTLEEGLTYTYNWINEQIKEYAAAGKATDALTTSKVCSQQMTEECDMKHATESQ
jgi:GDP-D-mannose 3',5'-epimerase